jgi:hypothetical protein
MSDLLGGLRWAEGIRQRGDGTKTTNDFCVLALADEVISLRKYAREMEAKLSLYTSWQPSDPGTKEAMRWAEDGNQILMKGPHPWNGGVLAHALRAAMVRLEEAEKKIVLVEAENFDLKYKGVTTTVMENNTRLRADVAALTAELTEIKKLIESDKYEGSALCQMYLAQSEAFKALTASLAELRKRMGEAVEALVRAERFVSNVYNFTPTTNGLDMRDTRRFGLELRALLAILASPPSPAPVESKPCEGIKKGLRCSPCVEAKRTCQPEGIIPPVESKPKPCPCSTCTAMHDANGFHRPAADTAKPSQDKL